jgi:hypothetical protein
LLSFWGAYGHYGYGSFFKVCPKLEVWRPKMIFPTKATCPLFRGYLFLYLVMKLPLLCLLLAIIWCGNQPCKAQLPSDAFLQEVDFSKAPQVIFPAMALPHSSSTLSSTNSGIPHYYDTVFTYNWNDFWQTYHYQSQTIRRWDANQRPTGFFFSSEDRDIWGNRITNAGGVTYDSFGNVISENFGSGSRTNSSSQNTQSFNGAGKIVNKRTVSSTGVYTRYYWKRLIQFNYDQNGLKEIIHSEGSEDTIYLLPVEKFSHLQYDTAGKITAYIYQNAPRGASDWSPWLWLTTGLEWDLGHNPSSLRIPSASTASSFTPYLTTNTLAAYARPTRKEVYLYSLAGNWLLERVTNSGWHGDSLLVTSESLDNTGALDTTKQELFVLDSMGRLIHYTIWQNDSSNTLSPFESLFWSYNLNNLLENQSKFTQWLPTGQWGDSASHSFAYVFDNAANPRLLQRIDSTSKNGVAGRKILNEYKYIGLPLSADGEIRSNSSLFSVYPNPGYGTFELRGHAFQNAVHVQVINNLGKVVLQLNHQDFSEGRLALQLEGFAAGIYHVLLKADETIATQRLVLH